jgi:hypothetical protein
MLKLHPSLEKFLNNNYKYSRVLISAIEIKGILHLLVPSQCPCCDGMGKYLCESMRDHVFTQEDLQKDPNFHEDMIRGKYDVPCEVCMAEGYVMTLAHDEINKDLLNGWHRQIQIEMGEL